MGQRNPLQLFNDSQKESIAPEPSDETPQEDSGISKSDSVIKIHESGKNNQESGIRNEDSGASKQESEDTKATPLYPLSARIPEPLNDALDDAVKQTRRSMGRKIRKEVLVSLAIEAMLQRVEAAGGWRAIASEEELRKLLGLQNE
ncbi:hypothetical protein AVDCRST_MAG92-1317 [uncultured Coleofasciculus sp.]|uniref:Uncharacterized protein n=1 Tax=uncultured Coleofasciculus sp. TaxID=1267456 RepID=A0A6J4I0T9_9CYAN|nr:hypothetical protein AVDCRST_MAG92-1317 [uncultured Coleofasciculus sp.]